MKVYALQTHEPITSLLGGAEPLMAGMPAIYATREIAEVAAKEYNDEFQHEVPATVVEIQVKE